jgi:hypothetical protein
LNVRFQKFLIENIIKLKLTEMINQIREYFRKPGVESIHL